MSTSSLSERDKSMLFWASFLSLAAAGVGFAFRVMLPTIWEPEFNLTSEQVGVIAGAALWPIAITMILFSLLVDKIGYKISMYCAFGLQLSSVVLTFFAQNADILWWACFFAGLGHGVVEAVINPLCASIYRKEKTKMLNILHASWPAGIVVGGFVFLVIGDGLAWRTTFLLMSLPVIAYGVMFFKCKNFPVDERVENNVSYRDMLKEFGGLGAFLAITFLFYEFANHIGFLKSLVGDYQLLSSIFVGAIGGTIFGFQLQSKGKWLFFFLCLVMIPLATAELATDYWIQAIMKPILSVDYSINAGWAIVLSAAIMMTLRFFAGVPLKYMSPPALLIVSSCFSIVGLYALAGSSGLWIFIAFVLYAIGQTFYWPTVLGFVSEQFPKGGAMTLNTVSALGLLTVGIFGVPFLGAVKDSYDAKAVKQEQPLLFDKYSKQESFFGVKYNSIKSHEVLDDMYLGPDNKEKLKRKIDNSARSTLRVASILPVIMAIAFLLMLLYFRSRGGYKPIDLSVKNDS